MVKFLIVEMGWLIALLLLVATGTDIQPVKKLTQEDQETKTANISQNNESIVEDGERGADIPTSILEKGIIYFFF